MLRRDYILKMISEFIEVLNRIDSYKKRQLWDEACGEVDAELERLVGASAEEVTGWTETELLAKVVQGEPTQIIRDKTAILSTLLKEAGDVAAAQGRAEEARLLHLRGLHLLLDVLGQGDVWEFPEFLPKIEAFNAALSGAELPLGTHARLMQHYERAGEFGKAEDELFAIVQAEPGAAGLFEFGLGFYERLRSRTDHELEEGNLPRTELEAGLAEFRKQASGAVLH